MSVEKEEFIGEEIKPDKDSFDTAMMSGASPGLPEKFHWHGREYQVAEILDTWRETGPCTHGSGERYVRKHWYKIRTTTGEVMKIYFERKARKGGALKRWWLFSLQRP